MIAARDCAPRAIGELLRGQPLSKAKIRFAWHTSVGSSMARATSVELDPKGTLYVRTDSGALAARDHPFGWRHQAAIGQTARPTCREAGGGKTKRLIMRESVIISAVRVPTGKFLGALKSLPATELGSRVIREAVSRAHIDASEVDECIMGNVVPAGLGQAPARQAALGGGLPDHVGALTINKVCGSGLKAVMLAAQGIATGDIDVAVAGGMESMSNCPYLLPKAREGMRMGNAEVIDSMIHDGLWCSLEDWSMGLACEAVADKYKRKPRRSGRVRGR